MKNSIIIYATYAEQIELLSMEQRGMLLTALMAYAAHTDLPDMDGMTKMAFSFIRSQIDRDAEKYQKTLEARREAGKMGGRPKANASDENQAKAKKANGFAKKQKNPVYEYEYDYEYVDDKKDIKTFCPEPEKSAPGTTDKTAVSFVLNDGSMYNVTENDVVKYQQLYPGIDCMQELRKIVGWCDSNPKNRKTRNGAKRFVNNWLARAQDKARPSAPVTKANRFHNFDAVGYDYDAIVKELNR